MQGYRMHDGGTPRDGRRARGARRREDLRRPQEYDLIVVHDPQPLALLRLHGKGAVRWVWRCHIDSSEPNPQVRDFLRPYANPERFMRATA